MDVELRSATPADRAFFREVYATTRADELALTPWDDAAKAAFVDQQFGAQSTHYAGQYPDASVDVILVAGEPAGRLYVHRGEREIRVVDIALLPDFRGTGVGTALLEALLDEARAGGRTVSIHVEEGNPARRLYERLGFVPAGGQGVHVLMRWAPDDQPNTAS